MTYIIYLKVKRKILNFLYKLNGTDKLYGKIYKVHKKYISVIMSISEMELLYIIVSFHLPLKVIHLK